MNQPPSRARLLILVALLILETALTISLRTSGWIATGHGIRQVLIGIAVILPLLMAVVLLYRVRDRLRRGQFSLRTLLAINLVIAFYLGLWPLFVKPGEAAPPNRGPSPLSPSARFEVYQVAITPAPSDSTFTEPGTGATFRVSNPPILTAPDVWTVELTRPGETQPRACLTFAFQGPGANRLLAATTAAKGSRLVFVVDGEVIGTPRIHVPVGTPVQLSGGSIEGEGDKLFDALTVEKTAADEAEKIEPLGDK